MRILGLLKTTLLDYPHKVAATVFTGGCNFRCPFCHNMDIVLSNEASVYSEEDILSFLNKRAGILEGVCITGGEPTLCPDLYDFIGKIRTSGLSVKLDTNGSNPDVLLRLINDGLIDYAAMDIKSCKSEYSRVCGVNVNMQNILKSIDILMQSPIDYEFRTTLIKEYHTLPVMEEIGQMLNGASNYYLQNFKDSEYVPDHSLSPVDEAVIDEYVSMLSGHIQNVYKRGI